MDEERAKSPLTSRQQAVLEFISQFFSRHGFAPSIREICKALKMASPRGAHKHLQALEAKGYIHRAEGARSIQIYPSLFSTLSQAIINLPLIGTVQAGKPILAEENIEEIVPVAQSIFGSIHEGFLLKIKGDSMIDANIAPGDFVVVKPQPNAQRGDIVVALIEGEATVKYFFPEKNAILLKPANHRYLEIKVEKDFKLIGKVIGLIRNYERSIMKRGS